MYILSVNAGSSSLKFQLIDMPNEVVIASGLFERIGSKEAVYVLKYRGEKIEYKEEMKDHSRAVELLISSLLDNKIISSLNELKGIGHRIVHGGEKYKDSVIFNEEVENDIRNLFELAPLHNPANLNGYLSFKKALPKVIQVAVFDTAFHQTMDEVSYLYSIPYSYYTDYKVRRYGFHGTSHKYVSEKVIKLLNKKHTKIITCHLGNGASLTAIKDGHSITTSMGFTPLAGVMMGTRSGDIDPAIITYLATKTKKSAEAIIEVLNKKSGLLGVSEVSNDARDIQKAISEGNHLASVAQQMYVNSVAERIGSYFIKLGGLDALIFTAGIGENDVAVRAQIINKLSESLPIKLDIEANNIKSKEVEISTKDSKIKAYIIPTNEELMIAKDVIRVGKL